MKNNIIILDNGGETFDRYTIIDRNTGEMFGASCDPFAPLGFGQYCGNVAENYYRVTFSIGWRMGCDAKLLKKRIRYAVDNLLGDCSHIGRKVDFDTIPQRVKNYALQCTQVEILN